MNLAQINWSPESRKRTIKVSILAVLLLCVAIQAYAWKPRTHIYIANIVLDDARDGKVSIPPYGEFEIDPRYREIIRGGQFDRFVRAGAIGPDGFPDMITGQANIHPANTDAWLLYLRSQAGQINKPEAWAFYFGYLIHCASDMWAHDWVDAYAGGSFPDVADFLGEEAGGALRNVTVHSAIEKALEESLDHNNPHLDVSIDAPNDYLFNVIVNSQTVGYERCGDLITQPSFMPGSKNQMIPVMNFFIDPLVELYWAKQGKRKSNILGIDTYDAAWYDDLKLGLEEWVKANERAMQSSVQPDGNMFKALEDEWSTWASRHLLDMLGFPSATRHWSRLNEAISEPVRQLLESFGINIDKLKEDFVNYLLKETTGRTKDQWLEHFDAELVAALMGDDLDQVIREIGVVPPQARWTDIHFLKTSEEVNGPLYNSVITSKLALLDGAGLSRLTDGRGTFAADDFVPGGIYSLDGWGQYEVGTFGRLYDTIKDQALKSCTSGLDVLGERFASLPIGQAYESDLIRSMRVWIHTANSSGAGTDADVYCEVYFENGEMVRKKLDIANYNDLEQNDKDTYEFSIDLDRQISAPESQRLRARGISRIQLRMTKEIGLFVDWKCDRMRLEINGEQVLDQKVNKWFKKKGHRWEVSVNGLGTKGIRPPGPCGPSDVDGQSFPGRMADQEWIPSANRYQGISGGATAAQTFAIGTGGVLKRLELGVYRAPDANSELLVRILRTDSRGIPGTEESDVLYSEYLSPGRFSRTGERDFAGIDLSSASVQVWPGDQLAITLSNRGSANYDWRYDDGYEAGRGYLLDRKALRWSEKGADFAFRSFVDPRETPEPGAAIEWVPDTPRSSQLQENKTNLQTFTVLERGNLQTVELGIYRTADDCDRLEVRILGLEGASLPEDRYSGVLFSERLPAERFPLGEDKSLTTIDVSEAHIAVQPGQRLGIAVTNLGFPPYEWRYLDGYQDGQAYIESRSGWNDWKCDYIFRCRVSP
ncbi:MAG: PLAT/LH2 domain-containing protein [bacterium]